MTEELPLCECGCGEPVAKKGNRFIRQHHKRCGTYWKTQQKPQLCECGCGEYAKPGNRFIIGHSGGPHKHSMKTRIKMGKIRTQYYIDNPDAINKMINSKNSEINNGNMRGGNDIVKHHFIYDHSDLSKYIMKITRKEHSKLHRNMYLLGLKLPHINTGHENEEELKLMEYIKKIEIEV